LPIFYNYQTQGRDRYAGLIQAAGIMASVFAPQIGAAVLGPGFSAATYAAVGGSIAGFVTSGGDLEAGIKAGLASYLGGKAGSWAGNAANSALVGNIASNMTRAAILGQDMDKALVTSLVQSAPAEITKFFPSFSELPRAAQETIVAATVDLMRTGGDNLDKIAITGVSQGVTDYALKNIEGFSDLRPGQQDALRTRISNIVEGKDITNEILQGAIQLGSEAVKYEVDTDRAVKAGWKTLEEKQAATALFGSNVTPALYADKQETTEEEAKQIARDILGREPTEFEYMQLIGLPENEAAKNSDLAAIKYDESTFDSNELAEAYKAVYGKEPTKEWLASDEAMDMLGRSDAQGRNLLQNAYINEQNEIIKDKNWVTEDEAKQFWKDTGNTGPIPQDFMDNMLMNSEAGAKAMAETYRINAEDIAATTFDGSKYATPQEAAAAAKAAGFNAFTHKDKNLTYFTQPSPIEEAEARANVEEKKTFSEAFAAARKELGAGKTFTWNNKQYTTDVLPKDTFDASRSSSVTTAATLAYANGKDKFIGPDGKTYKLDDTVKSVLDNSVNQSEAETQRLLRQAIKPATNETAAETQRLMESGTRGTMDTINAMAAQALGTTQRGFGNFLSNAGKTYAAMTGDLDFDNAAIKLGKEIESYAKGSDIYGLDVQKNRLSQAMARADETDNWIEKTKILGSAISKNSLGFFDVAGSEVVEELPETILQIGAALMTGGTTLAAKGAVTVIGAAGSVMETFGNTVEDTYNKAKKAGFSESESMNKAYINGVLSTAIEAGTNFVADKAMLAPFLNKFTGTLAGTATGFVSSTTIGAASNLAAGLSQSYATQYMIDPKTASLSKAATDGIFEMFIGGTAQGAMGLPGYAIQGGAIIGKDYFGKNLTMADVAAGAVLDSSTINPNATIATSDDGDPVTLGGAMLQMPNYQFDMSTLKTYVPQVFNNDNLIIGQDEQGNDVTFGELTGKATASLDFDTLYKNLLDVTPQQRIDTATAAKAAADKATADKVAADKAAADAKAASDAAAAKAAADAKTKADADAKAAADAQAAADKAAADAKAKADAAAAKAAQDASDAAAAKAAADAAALAAQKAQEAADAKAAADAALKAQADANTAAAEATRLANEAVNANLTQTKSDILAEVAKNEASGLSRDAALQKALETVSAAQKTDSASLLEKLGTTEASLKAEFEAGLAGVSTEIADTRKALEDAIQAAKDIGLAGDAALQAGLNSLSAKMGINQTALLAKLGTTEAALKTQFTTQVSNLDAKLTKAIADAKASGLAGDAALQSAIGKVAAELGTTKADVLSQVGKTEAALRSEMESGFAGVNEQYNALNTAQKATADALVAQGKTLQDAIAQAKSETTGQIAGVESRLTDAIKAAEAMGLSRDQAITAAVESVAADLGTTKDALLTQLGTTEAALRTEFATGLAGVSAEVKAAYDSLTAEQKALATSLQQQGVDLNTAIATAQAQTQQQITDLGKDVDARISQLMQQGQTYQQATQQAFAEVNAKNQELSGLIGTQGRTANQSDIDALNQMLGGQRSIDLNYDVTGDKQITQADIDFLTQVVGGVKTDWTAPQQSPWAATGLYGQIQANELQRQKDLADVTRAAEAQRLADQQAAAEEARRGNIRSTLSQGQQQLQGIQQQIPQAFKQAQEISTPIYGQMGPYLDIGSELDFDFFKPSPEKQVGTKQQQTTKIAAGGYIDDLLAENMTADDLLNLLR
jgi:hypothetical protein